MISNHSPLRWPNWREVYEVWSRVRPPELEVVLFVIGSIAKTGCGSIGASVNKLCSDLLLPTRPTIYWRRFQPLRRSASRRSRSTRVVARKEPTNSRPS